MEGDDGNNFFKSMQPVPHEIIIKLSISDVLKHFSEINPKKNLLGQLFSVLKHFYGN